MTMLCDPGVLYRASFAKYAAAFFNISRSNLTLANSLFKRLISSDAGYFEVRVLPLSPEYALTQLYKLFGVTPSSRAVWLIG